ncbi:AraC family transcriptional regulator [Parachitinimonas caeni]|uniref:AraC family transcriptional regulator n=1 Tax=Parachitinimonas caeni TaxID=3031301 RepID=A0ABT7DYQ5_9NEIS|nr:AraC family transcriptional regulator [Parachitinimonas caeni]MDK2125196.1 AraC family transcriptional regulator [Parachitinimonas caeni]
MKEATAEESESAVSPDRQALHVAAQTAMLFDGMPGFAYVVKDAAGRYVAFNQSILQRVKARWPDDIRGLTAAQIWPEALAQRYVAQDRWLLARRLPIIDQIDPILYNHGETGWCKTCKYPLLDRDGQMLGILCLSHDLPDASRHGLITHQLAGVLDRISMHFDEKLQIADLASQAGLGLEQFALRVRKIFGISPAELILRNRIRSACALLRRGDDTLSDIAQQCGFYDHSQFSRQFRRMIGVNPSHYRKWLQTQSEPTWVSWEPRWPN